MSDTTELRPQAPDVKRTGVGADQLQERLPVLPLDARRDLTRTTFAVLFMVGLIGASLWIMKPFIAALIWAAMIVVATWRLMLNVQSKLWNRRGLAATVMTTALLLAFVIPLWVAIATVVENADEIATWVRTIRNAALPSLPTWVTTLPFVGPKMAASWNEIITAGPEALTARVEPYARRVLTWFVAEVGGFGMLALQFFMTVIIAAILYARGEAAARGIRMFFRRLAGARGEEVVDLAGQAIRGVAFGIVITAAVQSLLGAIGLAVAGVPFVGLLTALMFVLGIAQVGAVPVLVCAVGWVWWQDSTGWAIALGVWTLFVGSIDNVLRPILIRRGGQLPFLLVFAGVIGGLAAFGLVGLFIGPLVLAVSYRLIVEWVRDAEPARRQSDVVPQ